MFTPHSAGDPPSRDWCVVWHVWSKRMSGVLIYENTRVTAIEPRPRRDHDHGTVPCPTTSLRATEGWTAELPGRERDIVPIYSLMIATGPLPARSGRRVGLGRRRSATAGTDHLRAAHGRRPVRVRRRGAPYHFGSGSSRRTTGAASTSPCERTLRELFPQLRRPPVTHAWGGPLGIARDRTASSCTTRRRASAAGGYVGDGVGTTNLAGRTLADLVPGATPS